EPATTSAVGIRPFVLVILNSPQCTDRDHAASWRVRSMKDQAREVVQVVLPDREGVAADIDLPNMRHVVLDQVVVNALTDVEQSILVAARDPKQLQSLGCTA